MARGLVFAVKNVSGIVGSVKYSKCTWSKSVLPPPATFELVLILPPNPNPKPPFCCETEITSPGAMFIASILVINSTRRRKKRDDAM